MAVTVPFPVMGPARVIVLPAALSLSMTREMFPSTDRGAVRVIPVPPVLYLITVPSSR